MWQIPNNAQINFRGACCHEVQSKVQSEGLHLSLELQDFTILDVCEYMFTINKSKVEVYFCYF